MTSRQYPYTNSNLSILSYLRSKQPSDSFRDNVNQSLHKHCTSPGLLRQPQVLHDSGSHSGSDAGKMPKSSDSAQLTAPHFERHHRHSLQPPSAVAETPLRHTRSHNYDAKKKKKVTTLPPPIPEVEVADSEPQKEKTKVEVVNEVVKERQHSKRSRKGSQNSQRAGFDNIAFEADNNAPRLSRNSANSARSSSRPPSVHSGSGVVREQYCCCTRYNPCERTLFATIGVLIFIIVVLLIAVIVLAVNNKGEVKKFFSKLIT